MLPSIINIHQGIQKLWTGHDLHRQTEGRTDKVIPIYPLNFVRGKGGGGNGTSSLTQFVTLNLHLCIPLLFQTHLLMMDNNVTKYHQYPSRHSKVVDRTRFAQTDGRPAGRTDKVIPIYPLNFVRGGYNE
jgi:hypothetical protein